MNVLVLSIEFPPGPGGIGTYAFQIARHLHQLGCDVNVAAPQPFATQDEIAKFNSSQPYKLFNFPFRGPFLRESIERFAITERICRQHKPEVIVAFGMQAVWLGAVVSVINRIPLVSTGAGSEFAIRGLFKSSLSRWSFRQSNLVVFISQYTYSLATQNRFHPENSVVIPLGADQEEFHPKSKNPVLVHKHGLLGKRVILSVGQVSERKAHDIVIRALPQVLHECPETIYLIVGLPTQQATLDDLADELRVKDHVLFAGQVDRSELPDYYNLADVFVLVSRQTQQGEVEGFGIVAVEASLCEVPCVVSENTGLVEAVIPGETALIVPQESPNATAKALLRLLSNEPLRASMGQAARQHALKFFTWEQNTLKLFQHLQKVIG